MSATGRTSSSGYVRDPSDYFRTPSWCTRAVLPHVIDRRVAFVLDPACGDGAILDVVREVRPIAQTVGIEIDAERAATCAARGHHVIVGDALAHEGTRVDLVVMNPPFSLAMEFITRAFGMADTVACLLRLSFLASQERAAFWRSRPADVYVMSRRPSFAASIKCKAKCGYAETLPLDAPRPKSCPKCGGKVTVCTSDSSDYAWFVWGDDRGGRWHVLDVEGAR